MQRKRLKKSKSLSAASKQRQQAHSRNKLMDWDVASLEEHNEYVSTANFATHVVMRTANFK